MALCSPARACPALHSADKDRVAALEVAFCLLQDHVHVDSLIDADGLCQQLCEARVRLVLVEAGLDRYLHLAGDEAATIITSLYTELPLQKDKPCMTPIVLLQYT